METECSICREDPGSHSFEKLQETDTTVYYYTCPGKASRYNDLEGILNHKRMELSKLNGKSWIWILDGTGFDMRHVMELQIGIGIAKLLDEYSVSKVYVINPGRYIRIISGLMWSFISEDLKSRIEFLI
jgi:hypothetical protein